MVPDLYLLCLILSYRGREETRTELIWLKIMGSCEDGNETLGSIKCVEFFDKLKHPLL